MSLFSVFVLAFLPTLICLFSQPLCDDEKEKIVTQKWDAREVQPYFRLSRPEGPLTAISISGEFLNWSTLQYLERKMLDDNMFTSIHTKGPKKQKLSLTKKHMYSRVVNNIK